MAVTKCHQSQVSLFLVLTRTMCLLCCSMMAAFSEGLAVADKAGLSQQTLLEVLVFTTFLDHVLLLENVSTNSTCLFHSVRNWRFVGATCSRLKIKRMKLMDTLRKFAGAGSYWKHDVQTERTNDDSRQIPTCVSIEAPTEGYAPCTSPWG